MTENPLFRWFHRFFPRPVFPADAQKTRLGAMVNDFFGVAILIGIANILITVPLGLFVSISTVMITVSAVIFSIAALRFVRRGHVYPVATLGTLLLILIGVLAMYKVGTVQALQMAALFTAIVFATLSMGPLVGASVVMILAAIMGAFTYAQVHGFLVPGIPPSLWSQFILFTSHGFLLYLLSALIRHHMAEAVADEQAMTAKVSDLLNDVSHARAVAEETGKRYRSVIENVSEAILVIQDQHVVFCNPRLEVMVGMTTKEILNRPFIDFVVEEDRPLLMNKQERRHAGESIIEHFAFRVRVADSSIRWIEASGVEIEWNRRSATLAFARDVTDRHHLEEQLQKSLAEAREAQQRADAANQSKSRFLANMSHEIRTPMNSVLGMTHLALRTALTRQQQDYLKKIQGSGTHLLQLIDDILDLSKIEAGKLTIESAPFSLDELLGDVRTILEPRAHEKHLQLSITVLPGTPRYFLGDSLRIRQILINLTGNAIKFTAHGTVSILVTADEIAEDSALLRIDVTDTGIGLDPEQVTNLFQAFQQADASTTRQFGGTGLGLAISRQLVERMGGTIGVVSTPGQGSTFSFTLRLQPIASAISTHEPASESATDNNPPGPAFAGYRVLLAEDDPLNQQVAGEMLADLGIQVTLAETGAAAIESLKHRACDLVLMDMQMPVMDGLAATRAIRSDESWSQIPVIALTANASLNDRNTCLAAGMNDFLTKPIDPHRLRLSLERWLKEKSSPIGGSEAPPGTPTTFPSPPPIGPAQPEAADFDTRIFFQLAHGKPEKALSMATAFQSSLQAMATEICAALDQRDYGRLHAAGHRLKSSARWINVTTLAQLCEQLEFAAKNLNTDQALACAEAVLELIPVVTTQVEAFIAVPTPPDPPPH